MRHEMTLKKAQQSLSRKEKFSSNWRKAKRKVQPAISQNHAMVCIKDLQVRNMSKSVAGTSEAPGRNVKAKSGLNKAILDQGWFKFRRQLQYKLEWNGGMLIAVPPQNTSRTCPACGIYPRTTVRRKLNLYALNAAMKITPMSSARSIS